MKTRCLALACFIAITFAQEVEDVTAGELEQVASTTSAPTTALPSQTPFAFAPRNDEGKYNPYPGFYEPNNRFGNNGQYNAFGRYNNAFPSRYNNFGRSNKFRNYNDYVQQQQNNVFRAFSTTAAPTTVVSGTEDDTPAARLSAFARASSNSGNFVSEAGAPALIPRSNFNDASSNILKYSNDIGPDGTFSYYYENDNGIAAQAEGVPKTFAGNPPVSPVVHQGSFTWTSPEGKVVTITYVADENGYQPQGDAIPTPPPVPELIARSLAYLRTIPENQL